MKDLGNVYEVEFLEGAPYVESFRTNVLAESVEGAIAKVKDSHSGAKISSALRSTP